MTPRTIVICGTPGAWIGEIQKRYARELGSGSVELVIPNRGEKHYGLLQSTLARLKREKRELTKLLIRRGFGLSAFLFEKISVETGGRAELLHHDLGEVLTEHFRRNPGPPIDCLRLASLTGPRLLVIHEPLVFSDPARALAQFGIEHGIGLYTEFIEITPVLSKSNLAQAVRGFQPTALVVSTYRERVWRPSELILGDPSVVPQGCKIWTGRTVFHALYSLLSDASATA